MELQQLHQRHRLLGVAALLAAVAVAGLAASDGTASAAVTVTTVPYTSTGPGGGLNHPGGVAAYGGHVYVSNTGPNVVSELADGTTTQIAGSLTDYGEHGDGGPAASATLYRPAGTAVDARGDVYIDDAGDNVVREITPDGVIHKIAGTGLAGLGITGPFGFPAALSSLDHPEGLAVDAKGNAYIADTYNNRVLKVTPQGLVFTVAGTGIAGYSGDRLLGAFAELNQPSGVAVDAAGDVYIADSANNVIRRVDARTGIITTVAGDFAADKASGGLGGYAGDGGRATQAELNDPQGVAVDAAGNVFIADTFNSAIRVVTPGGTIATLTTGQSAPYSVTVDPASPGTLYWANANGNQIRQAAYDPAAPAGTAAPTTS